MHQDPAPTRHVPLMSAAAPSRTRYWVIVFAITLAVIQYIDRVCISQAAPLVMEDLKLTKAQMGWVFSAFTLAYALFEIPAGYLGDRIGPRKVLLRIVLWWSFFTMATGWVKNLWSLITVRFLFGAGEAGAFPNLTKAFNRWLPLEERPRAQGIMWMSARLGGAFTPLLVLACLQHMHWRTTFLVFGLVGVVWAVIFHWWYRDDPRRHPGVNAGEAALLPVEQGSGSHVHIPWKKLLASKTVWCLCGQYFACSYCFYFFITWFPSYLLEQHGFNMKETAWLAGTPLMLAAIGSLAAGWISPILSRQLRSVRRTRCWLGAVGAAGAGCMLVVAANFANPWLAVAAIAGAAFFNDLQMPGAWTACMDVGGRAVGTLSGTMNMMGNFGGFLSPIATGYFVQQTGNWETAFYVTAAMYLLGIFSWLAMDPVTPLEEQS